MNNLVGTIFGQYEIVEKIGQGGMAHVFKARQLNLDRYVAVKILSPSLAEQPGFAERFQREAHAVARLHHPNILQVYDYGVEDKYNYIVMRYVEGSKTLSDLIQENPPLDQIIDYIAQIADALGYAHERGVVHRDVKPSNVLIDGKWAYLGDFGLVKLAESSSHLTGTGVSIGTPAYMSPEQVNGSGKVDHRTDIFALGIILYKVLTGTVPHEAKTPIAVLVKRSTEPVTPIGKVKPMVPRSLQAVTMRSLAMEPDARYTSATDFATALKSAKEEAHLGDKTLTDIEGATLPSGFKTPLPAALEQPASTSRKMGFWLGLGLLAILLLSGLIFFMRSWLGDDSSNVSQLPTPSPEVSEDVGGVVAPPDDPTKTPMIETPTTLSNQTPSATMKSRHEVWSGPGEIYELIGYLPEGSVVQIVSRDESGGWWQINTTLTSSGVGWIPVGSDIEVSNAENVPIALAPPTPTETTVPATNTPTPTATPKAEPTTATPTLTPTETVATPTPAATPQPRATPTTALPSGQFVLLTPISLDEPSFGPTEFEWQWSDPLAENQGFEVRVWLDGEAPSGVHNAVLDNKNGAVQALGNNRYRLNVDISEASGVRGRSGDYNWTVLLVQIEPEYKELGIQAVPPAQLRYAAPGPSGGSGGDGGPGGLDSD